MALFPNGETVGVIRPTTTSDRYNNTTRTWGTVPTHEVAGCAFDPGGSSEENDGRTATVTTPTLYAPPGADLDAADQVLVRGDIFEVLGVPAVWVNPFDGQTKGVVASLRKVDG